MYKFQECNCVWPTDENDKPIIDYDDVLAHNLECPATWDLISSGNTKGVFQLESPLGQSLAKKLKPRNIEHLSALVAIMRPGSLESFDEQGKSVTQHYIDRKNNIEEVSYYHPSLKNALGKTLGLNIYQENSMQIAKDIAGFSLQDADVMRKAIGKKLPKLMAEVQTKFLEGCKTVGLVNEGEAVEIFNGIKASQRYAFNKSHSVSYAFNSYLSAYAKAHSLEPFFTSYLYYAHECTKPLEEIEELVQNARSMDVVVDPPDLCKGNRKFKLVDKEIYFGIGDIKGVGTVVMQKLQDKLATVGDICEKDWLAFLIFITPYINSIAIRALICCGALRHFGVERTKLLYEYIKYMELSKKEQSWIEIQYHTKQWVSLEQVFADAIASPTGRQGCCANKNRKAQMVNLIKELTNPPYKLEDSAEWIEQEEKSLLGISITCSALDEKHVLNANCTCKDFLEGRNLPEALCIAIKVDRINEIKTKNGKNPGQLMSFLTVSDSYGQLSTVVAFPNVWKELRALLAVGNQVAIFGKKGKDKETFILLKAEQI